MADQKNAAKGPATVHDIKREYSIGGCYCWLMVATVFHGLSFTLPWVFYDSSAGDIELDLWGRLSYGDAEVTIPEAEVAGKHALMGLYAGAAFAFVGLVLLFQPFWKPDLLSGRNWILCFSLAFWLASFSIGGGLADYCVRIDPVCTDIEFIASPNDDGSEATYWEAWGFWLALIGASLYFLAGLTLLVANKLIRHFACALLSFLLIAVIVLWIINGAWWFSIPFGCLYLLILSETFGSSTMQYLKNMHTHESAQAYITRLRKSQPYLRFAIECWHEETRTKTTTYTNRDTGETTTETESYTVRVSTYTENEYFPISRFEDISGDLVGIDDYPVTKLIMTKTYFLGDAATIAAYNQRSSDIVERNRHRDVNIDFSETFGFDGYVEKLLAFVDVNHKPWICDPTRFFILSALLLSLPIRAYISYLARERTFQFQKQLFSE